MNYDNEVKLKPFKLGALHKELRNYIIDYKSDDYIWCLDIPKGKHIILEAGWNETATDPMDLGKTGLGCKAFCHFGCYSFKHFYKVVQEMKRWGGLFFGTSSTSYAEVAFFFIFHVLNYNPKAKDARALSVPPPKKMPPDWNSILRYAVLKTNKQLQKDGYHLKIMPIPKQQKR